MLGLLSLALFSFAARELGKRGLGLFTEATAFALFFLAFAGLGLSTVATREISRDRPNAREYAAKLAGVRMLVAALVAALTLVAALVGGEGTRSHGLVYLAVLAIPLEQAVRTMQDLFIGLERARLVAAANAVGAMVRIVVSFAALYAGFGLWGFMVGWLVADAANVLFFVLAAPDLARLWPRLDLRFSLEIIRKGLVFYFAGMLTTVYQRVDVLILGWAAGHEELGVYAAAMGLARRLIVIPDALGMATYAGVSAAAQKSRPVALDMAARAHGLGLAVTLPIAAGTTLLAAPIVAALFGAEYRDAVVPLALSGWAVPLWTSSYVALYTLSAVDRERQVLAIAGAITGTAVGVLLVAGERLDATVAAAAVVGGQAVGTVLFLWRTRREIGTIMRPRETLKVIAATLVMSAVLVLGRPWLGDLDAGRAVLPRLGALIVLAAAVYLGVATPLGIVPWRLLAARAVGKTASGDAGPPP